MLFNDLKVKYHGKPIFVCTPLHSQFKGNTTWPDKYEYTIVGDELVPNKYSAEGDILYRYV